MSEAWDWLAANGTGVSGLATVATAIVAIWTLVHISRDSHDRTRPLIVVSLENDDDYGMTVMSLVVKNWGTTAARELKVEFEPDIVAQHVESSSTLGYVARRYLNEIPLLAPGAALKNTWRVAGDPEGDGSSAPKVVTASVSYHGTSRKRLRERFTLDAHTIEQGTGAGHPSVRASLNQIAERVGTEGAN